MIEEHATRLKRLKMRSMRRGIKEMDLILSHYAEYLDQMEPAALDLYDQLLQENDQDLYAWVTMQTVPPELYGSLIKDIRQVFYNK